LSENDIFIEKELIESYLNLRNKESNSNFRYSIDKKNCGGKCNGGSLETRCPR
jgi:hypothetical protein